MNKQIASELYDEMISIAKIGTVIGVDFLSLNVKWPEFLNDKKSCIQKLAKRLNECEEELRWAKSRTHEVIATIYYDRKVGCEYYNYSDIYLEDGFIWHLTIRQTTSTNTYRVEEKMNIKSLRGVLLIEEIGL